MVARLVDNRRGNPCGCPSWAGTKPAPTFYWPVGQICVPYEVARLVDNRRGNPCGCPSWAGTKPAPTFYWPVGQICVPYEVARLVDNRRATLVVARLGQVQDLPLHFTGL